MVDPVNYMCDIGNEKISSKLPSREIVTGFANVGAVATASYGMWGRWRVASPGQYARRVRCFEKEEIHAPNEQSPSCDADAFIRIDKVGGMSPVLGPSVIRSRWVFPISWSQV